MINTEIIRLILVFTFSLLILLSACKKDDTTINSQVSNELYSSLNSYEATELGMFAYSPPHRTGPNELSGGGFTNLYLTIWVPSNAKQPLPVVVYSHGGNPRTSPGRSGIEWSKILAESGYAAIAMHHLARNSEDVRLNICGELNVEQQHCDVQDFSFHYYGTDRAEDAIYVMNILDSIGKDVGYEFDNGRIAIMGFSGGTNTTHYLSGGVRVSSFDSPVNDIISSFNESRPKAFLAMAPGGGVESGWTAESLSEISSPFFCLTGEGDNEVRAAFYDQLSGTDQYRLYIPSPSALHSSFNHAFAGNPEDQENQKLFHTWMDAAVIAFLDAYLLENETAKEWLRSPILPEIIHETLAEDVTYPTWSYR